jgi:hypothetical protein
MSPALVEITTVGGSTGWPQVSQTGSLRVLWTGDRAPKMRTSLTASGSTTAGPGPVTELVTIICTGADLKNTASLRWGSPPGRLRLPSLAVDGSWRYRMPRRRALPEHSAVFSADGRWLADKVARPIQARDPRGQIDGAMRPARFRRCHDQAEITRHPTRLVRA